MISKDRLSHYIAGTWNVPGNSEWTEDLNPSDASQTLAQIPLGDAEVVDQAVEAAQQAAIAWRASTGPARADVLHCVANRLAGARQELGRLVALEVGKPINEALQEVDRGVVILRYFAEEAVHPVGEVIPAQMAGGLQFTLRQPLGSVAVISPWNFPIAIPLWKIAPALAYGNTVVWKPAEVASFTALRLTRLFDQAGLPAGVLNLVLGRGSRIGEALTNHPGIRAVTFTGSNPVGMSIAESAARRNIKYQVEMGGKNAALVLADADLDQAARLVAAGAMRFAGQKCTATSRAIVAAEVAEAFLDRLASEIRALPVAPAIEATSAIGPLISHDALEKAIRYTEMGARTGSIVLGGNVSAVEACKQGFFLEPTVIVNVPNDSPVVQEEIFGPVLAVQMAQGIDEALVLANSTAYGLSVSLFTRDINAALRYLREIECGMVRVNGDTTGVDPHAPFGGLRGSSSHSREQGPAAIEFFTEIKTIQINPAGA
ncbi:MAG TPA: aldehyde dehydrogenase family protein [Ktedonobacteraceae bacterium]